MRAKWGDVKSYKPRPDGYIRRTVKGIRKMEHVRVWEEARGEIPKGYHVHHKNEKRSDNRLSNLELLSPLEHKRKHGGCYRNEKGKWVKPCTKCKKPKLLEGNFYVRRDKTIISECKPCHVKRSVEAKRARRGKNA